MKRLIAEVGPTPSGDRWPGGRCVMPLGSIIGVMVVAGGRITIDGERLADFCRRHHIRRLALFGSVLRQDFRPESDVDVVLEFEPGHVPGFGFVDVQMELSRLLGRRVDLHTPNSLSRYFRARVLAEAEVVYARGA